MEGIVTVYSKNFIHFCAFLLQDRERILSFDGYDYDDSAHLGNVFKSHPTTDLVPY